MAKSRAGRKRTRPRTTGGLTPATEKLRGGLAKRIATIIDDRELTQTEAAYLMKDSPSQISLVVTGKLRGFSPERLIRMLAKLGDNVEVVVRPSGKPTNGKIEFRQAAARAS